MIQKVHVEQMEVMAFHGCIPQERHVGRKFIVDAWVEADFTKAIETDDINEAVNYVEIMEIIQREMAIPSNLIETVADRIIKSIKRELKCAGQVYLKISKTSPPVDLNAKAVAVEILA